jgi:hypothetical protein
MPNNSGSNSGPQANPVIKFNGILGLYSLIQNNYIIDHIIPKPPPSPAPCASRLLRLLVALSSVLVRNNKVVAAALANQSPLSVIVSVDSDAVTAMASVDSDAMTTAASVDLDSDAELDISNIVTSKNPEKEEKWQKTYSITEPKIDPINSKVVPYLLKKW